MASERDGLLVLAVGATGSIGKLVVEEALKAGHRVRALVRDPRAALTLAKGIEVVTGDLTVPDSLPPALSGIDAVIFTHGTYGNLKAAEMVDYGGVANILGHLSRRHIHITLMTAIAVTDRKGSHDWKRRAERLVRLSGHSHTIVRPGWFDYNAADQNGPVFLQGDRRQSGTPGDGVVSRRLIAKVLVSAVSSPHADKKTFELVAEKGSEPAQFDTLLSMLDDDNAEALDGRHDLPNMALEGEPKNVRDTLQRLSSIRLSAA